MTPNATTRASLASAAVPAIVAALAAALALTGCAGGEPADPPASTGEAAAEEEVLYSDSGRIYHNASSMIDAFVEAGGPCDETAAVDGPGEENAACRSDGSETLFAWFETPAEGQEWAETEGIAFFEQTGLAVVLGGNWVILTDPENVEAAELVGGAALQEIPLD